MPSSSEGCIGDDALLFNLRLADGEGLSSSVFSRTLLRSAFIFGGVRTRLSDAAGYTLTNAADKM